MVARRNWTRSWWDRRAAEYEAVTSEAVLDELEKGDYPNKVKMLELMEPLLLVPVEPEIIDIVQYYIAHRLMPSEPTGDALYLALASFHKCEYLLTWNCRHLANPNKFHHIQMANAALGIPSPLLVTPLDLLGGDGDE